MPDRSEAVLAAAKAWARELRDREPKVRRVGCYGPYARGDADADSDLDLVVIVRDGEGAMRFDVTRLPVRAAVVVFEQRRWESECLESSGIAATIVSEARWF